MTTKLNAFLFFVGLMTFFCSVCTAQTASAGADVLEEIVVTATRREQSLQNVPISISALSDDFLKRIGAKDLGDYFGFAPSVAAAHNMLGERGGQNIIVRGVSNSRVASGLDSSSLTATTGFYINDIPVMPVDTQLIDVDRVEVVRGPQGTLYGAGSMGGAVRLFHHRPDLTNFEGMVEGTVGGLADGGEMAGLEGVINLPLVEGVLAARMSGGYRMRDGFIDSIVALPSNPVPNSSYPIGEPISPRPSGSYANYQEDANSAESMSARLALLYEPTENFSIEGAVLWQDSSIDDLNNFNTAYSDPRLQEKYLLEPNSSELIVNSLALSYNFGAVTLNSDTSFYTREYEEVTDFSLIGYNSFASDLDYIPAVMPLVTTIDTETFTQELRLQSNSGQFSNSILSRLDWVLGAFWMDESRDILGTTYAPGWGAAAPNNPLPVATDIRNVADNDVSDKSEAVFVDAMFNLTDRLAIGGGIRYFDLSTSLTTAILDQGDPVVPRITSLDQSESGSTPRLIVSYGFNDAINFYGSVADGFRLGGAKAPIDPSDTECIDVLEDNNLGQYAGGEFQSDSLRTYEVGLKTTFADGRARVNGAVYQTDWDDLQQQVRLADYPGSLCAATITANIGSSKIEGFELEFEALATESFLIRATASYTDARIEDPGVGGAIGDPGDRLQSVPEWAGSFSVDYRTQTNTLAGSDFFAHADLRYEGERSTIIGVPPDPLLIMDDYILANARAGFVFGEKPITVTLFIKNIFDEVVELNARNRIGVSGGNVIVATSLPRTIGLTIRKEF